jgi:hypothetical protein
MSQINEKNLNLSGKNLKKPQISKKKALHHYEQATIPLIMSSKSLVFYEKASPFLKKPPFLRKCLQKAS